MEFPNCGMRSCRYSAKRLASKSLFWEIWRAELMTGSASRVLVGSQFELGDLIAMNLVGAVEQAQPAITGKLSGLAEVGGDRGCTVGLDRPVDHLAQHPGSGDLDHGDFPTHALASDSVDLFCGVQRQEPRLIDHDAGFGGSLLPNCLV